MRTQQEIMELVEAAGERKARFVTTPGEYPRLILLAVLAGAFVALGGTLSVLVGYGFPGFSAANPGLQKLLSGLVFPVGLFLVVMFGAELFTGNNAVMMPSTLRGKHSAGVTIANWAIVWAGNFAGALLFTFFLVSLSGLLAAAPYADAITAIATAKTSLPASTCFLRGIGANWCVCMAVWLAIGAKTLVGKTVCCWIPVAAFVILGYEHCIANMFFIPAGIMAGAPVELTGLGWNLLWSTLGNITGGALFVGCLCTWLYSKGKITG